MNSSPLNIVRTIRGRIALLFMGIFGISLIGFSAVLYGLFSRQSRDDFDNGLLVLASSVAESFQEEGLSEKEIRQTLAETPILTTAGARRYVEVFDSSAALLVKTRELADRNLPVSGAAMSAALKGRQVFESSAWEKQDSLWDHWGIRCVLYPVVAGGAVRQVVVVGVPRSLIEASLLRIRIMLVSTVPIVLLLGAGAGWYLARRAFQPVDQIVRSAEMITAEQLHQRLPVKDVDDELRRLSVALNRMIERLEAAFQAQRRFSADASHELNTPLTILSGEIELGLEGSRSVGEYRAILRSALEEIRRLQKIVDSLLLLSRIEGGKFIRREIVRLDEVLMAAHQKVSHLAKPKKVQIDLMVEERDSESTEILVSGDQAMLLNVALNIFTNAVRYSPRGGRIVCKISSLNGNAVFSVHDQGPGIPHEHLAHVFERFYRADASRSRDARVGTGLGLAIAKAVVEAHGGTISLASQERKGTTVTVSLPTIQS